MHRFRAVPKSRQRETLEAMQALYAASGSLRGSVLREIPPLVRLGRDACLASASAPGSNCPEKTRLALERWPEPIETAAHEILSSEAKFRSLLWAVRRVRAVRDHEPDHSGLTKAGLEDVEALVKKMNDFAQMVELGLFEQVDVFGLLHRSIAPACKAIEPIVWARSAGGGRWGMRLLRLRLRAEHFNDVRPIHFTSPLVWTAPGVRSVCIHEPLYERTFDEVVPSARLIEMGSRQRIRLRWEQVATRVRPQFGGERLRCHIAAENRLAGQLAYALSRDLDPESFDWSVEASSGALRVSHEQARSTAPL